MKTTKKLISFLAVACLLVGSASAAYTPEIDVNTDPQGAYDSVNTYYVGFYRNEYVPSYLSYNQSLVNLAAEIQSASITTPEQAETILTFLNNLVSDKHAFFGNRYTPNTSRYDVPYYRDAMYAAVANQDYTSAYSNALTLIDEVALRINFLQGLQDQIDSFEIPGPEDPGSLSAAVSIDSGSSQWWYTATIVISNSTSSDISNWTFGMDYVGVISTVWADGSGLKTTNKNHHLTVSPQNKWQAVYTIPAGGSVTLKCNGNTLLTSVSNATLDGSAIEISFSA